MKKKSLISVELSRSKQTAINLIASMSVFALSFGISFFLSPYIVKTLGAEANGFVGLANNFISYASLVVCALNSMGSRFISISYHKGEIDKANKYYSSLFFADLMVAIVLSIASCFTVWKLENIINISDKLITDVRIVFALLFANFVISMIVTVFNSSIYITNRLYLSNIRSIESTIIRAIVIVVGFTFFEPKIYYLALGTFLGCLVMNGYICYYKYKLTPDLHASIKNFSWKYILELISSGVWNSISTAGQIMSDGFDLLIANIFISSTDMGVLSVAKSFPHIITTLCSTISSIFLPSMIIDYAHNDKKTLVKSIYSSSKILSVICTIPLCFLITFGQPFYALWQPTLDSKKLWILSVLTCGWLIMSAGIQNLFNVFTVVNKVRINAIVFLLCGGLSLGITVILLKTTTLGVYAVAGVSPIVGILRNIFFIIPFSAKYLGLKWNTFYRHLWTTLICAIPSLLIGSIMNCFIKPSNWLTLILCGIAFLLISFVFNIIVILNTNERKLILGKLKSYLK